MRTVALVAFALSALASPLIEPRKHVQTVLDGQVAPFGPYPDGWRDPRVGGGSMINRAVKKLGGWLGEPINVIVSGDSDKHILSANGFGQYAMSLGFADECMKQHRGGKQIADLGDGLGPKEQYSIFRQHYFPIFGTCWESLAGGQHFRTWRQNGPDANTGAWFIAASQEKYLGEHHTIVADGYNLGRDYLVERAVEGGSWKGMWWKADVEWREGLLEPGAEGINHNITQDGLVAILTVRRV
ncbi:hypothetical protein DL93DRAFT_2099502 [Clavulina sp. PMI_390]|nr:hypothetical protein DL93DRAFT_2099502 [Clavulina sp. PMI_390]